jgi:hypothetical protein
MSLAAAPFTSASPLDLLHCVQTVDILLPAKRKQHDVQGKLKAMTKPLMHTQDWLAGQ